MHIARATRCNSGEPVADYIPWRDWQSRLPAWPLSADCCLDGVYRRPREQALTFKNIEINSPGMANVLAFDIDRMDAFEAAENAGLPEPNVSIVSQVNGHAHLIYALRAPVSMGAKSRQAPIKLYQVVEHSMVQRLGADPAYTGRLVKNPQHHEWRTCWLTPHPFELRELLAQLELGKPSRKLQRSEVIGFGRNCELFDRVRKFAYQEIRKFETGPFDAWQRRILGVASDWNHDFELPLPGSEVRSVTKSISKWVWGRFTSDAFSQIQGHRARSRNIKRGQRNREAILSVAASYSGAVVEAPMPPVYLDMADDLPVPSECEGAEIRGCL